MKKSFLAALLAFASCADASEIYVGDWHVGEGPQWNSAVQTAYSGQEAAALLFGGVASDYSISTVSTNVGAINHMAWMDGYAIGLGILAEDYKNGNQYTNGVRSAYILDNSCSNRYDDPASICRDRYVNYAFRTANIPDSSNVPEPASVTLLGIGLLGFVASRRKSTK